MLKYLNVVLQARGHTSRWHVQSRCYQPISIDEPEPDLHLFVRRLNVPNNPDGAQVIQIDADSTLDLTWLSHPCIKAVTGDTIYSLRVESNSGLTSLNGCPSVMRNLSVCQNSLTSLAHAPSVVRELAVIHNPIVSFECDITKADEIDLSNIEIDDYSRICDFIKSTRGINVTLPTNKDGDYGVIKFPKGFMGILKCIDFSGLLTLSLRSGTRELYSDATLDAVVNQSKTIYEIITSSDNRRIKMLKIRQFMISIGASEDVLTF